MHPTALVALDLSPGQGPMLDCLGSTARAVIHRADQSGRTEVDVRRRPPVDPVQAA